MVICLGQGADLHMSQLMPLPLLSLARVKSRLVLVPAYPGNPEQSPETHKMDVCMISSVIFSCHHDLSTYLLPFY